MKIQNWALTRHKVPYRLWVLSTFIFTCAMSTLTQIRKCGYITKFHIEWVHIHTMITLASYFDKRIPPPPFYLEKSFFRKLYDNRHLTDP